MLGGCNRIRRRIGERQVYRAPRNNNNNNNNNNANP